MVETEITSKNWEYVKKTVSDVEYFGHGKAVVNVVMGWPLSGKTTGSKVLKSLIGPVISSDRERIYYKEAISQNEALPEKNKNRVYSELLDRLYWKISKGSPSSNIEATFTLKSRREKLFSILSQAAFADAYFWCFLRTEEDVEKRIKLREAEKERCIKRGEAFPANILVDYGIYREFMAGAGDDEKPSLFDAGEVPNALKNKVHILVYDTSRQDIRLYNPDGFLRDGARMLSESRTRIGEAAPSVKELCPIE